MHEQRGRWFYAGLGVVVLALATLGFLPGLVDAEARRGPVTPLVAVHSLAVTAWLLLLVTQSTLVATRRVDLHRRLGAAGAVLLGIIVVSSYQTTLVMARRGYRLAPGLDTSDMPQHLILPLGDLTSFTLLTVAALWFRRRPDVHRRLMLLGTVAGFVPASLAHFVGHNGLSPMITFFGTCALLFAPAVHDRLRAGRAHPVSLYGAAGIVVWLVLEVAVIGPSSAWRAVAVWLIG